MTARNISLIVEDAAWRKAGLDLVRIRAAARLALLRGLDHPSTNPTRPQNLCLHPSPLAAEEGRHGRFHRRSGAGEGLKQRQLTILLTNDTRQRALNAQFRGKDAPTNVLSFPAGRGSSYLGDVAIAFGVTSREAASSGIPLLAHTLHLTVHGVLHLLGYDHVKAREALTMERLEIAILAGLGLPSPYTRAAAAE